MPTHKKGPSEERDKEHGKRVMNTPPDRIAAGVGGCAPAAPREGEGLDPLP